MMASPLGPLPRNTLSQRSCAKISASWCPTGSRASLRHRPRHSRGTPTSTLATLWLRLVGVPSIPLANASRPGLQSTRFGPSCLSRRTNSRGGLGLLSSCMVGGGFACGLYPSGCPSWLRCVPATLPKPSAHLGLGRSSQRPWAMTAPPMYIANSGPVRGCYESAPFPCGELKSRPLSTYGSKRWPEQRA